MSPTGDGYEIWVGGISYIVIELSPVIGYRGRYIGVARGDCVEWVIDKGKSVNW